MEGEVSALVGDIRELMSPYTALKLKERSKANLKDYAEMSGPLGVTHVLAVSQNDEIVNFKIARAPTGPTLSFRVEGFTLGAQVKRVQRRPFSQGQRLFKTPPVVVTNNFGGDNAPPQVKLMRITFQNMFPSIDVSTIKLRDCKRVVLFDRREGVDGADDIIEMRHYAVQAGLTGVNRTIKRIVQAKIPNLGKCEDIADYVLAGNPVNADGDAGASDSEGEDTNNQVVLGQDMGGKGKKKGQKSALKLVELGPRLTLSLKKVERGLAGGDVMYHSFVKKSKEAALADKKRVEEAAALKKIRREEQDANVERKKKEKEEKRERKKRKREGGDGDGEGEGEGEDEDEDEDEGEGEGEGEGSDDGSKSESEDSSNDEE